MLELRLALPRRAIARASGPALGASAAVALVLVFSSAHAALPAQFERVKEIRAILDDAEVTKAFGPAHPIDKIERVENAHYEVSSGTCVMQVNLVSDPTVKHPAVWYGAWAFAVKAGPLVCH